MQPRLEYRPDIDGLRAIAVVAVILFHAELPGFTGGYVGVDVFFVISGYLITQRVVAGVEDGTFSFWRFYGKRVRRLLPAASTTVAATLAAGVVLLQPEQLRRLAQSVMAAATSVSNVWFWSQSGYWDAEATSKPLLHTWSLAVEEQFYLVWPLLMVAMVVWRRRRAIVPLVLLGLGSVALTWWITSVESAAAFYLTPFRVYEFVVGAGIVWLDRAEWPREPRFRLLRATLWVAGLAAIAVPVVAFDAATAFPGVAAAVPTLGTAAVIVARRPPGLDAVVSNGAATHLGLVSYSLYLVHWPVLVYTRAVTGELAWQSVVVALTLTVVLAELQYRFVERRFRWVGDGSLDWSSAAFRRVASPTLGISLAVVLAGCAVTASDGLPGRYDETVRDLATLTRDEVQRDRNAIRNGLCDSGDPPVCGDVRPGVTNVLVVGDSHGPDGVNIVDAAMPGANLLVSSRGGCPPLFDLTDIGHSFGRCEEYNQRRFDAIAQLADDLDAVVLSMRVDLDRVDPILTTVEWLEEDLDVDVAVVGQGPSYAEYARDAVVDGGDLSAASAALAAVTEPGLWRADEQLRRGVQERGAAYVPKLDWACPDRRCRAFARSGSTQLLVFDRHHLTYAGAAEFGRHAQDRIRSAIAE